MYTEEQLEQAFHAGKEYAHAARNAQPTIGLRFGDWKESLVKDSLPIYSKISFVNVYEDQECRFISDEEYETYESAFNNRDDLSTYKETVQIVRKTKQ